MPRRREHNAQLAGLLTESGTTAAELARSVNRLAAAEGLPLRYDRTTVAHWLTGSRPRGLVPQLVAEALSRRTGRLVSVSETGLGDRSPEAGLMPPDHGEQGDVVGNLITLARTDAHPTLRGRATKSVFRSMPVPPVSTEPGSTGVRRSGDRTAEVGQADIDRARFMLSHFTSNWYRYGGRHARAALASYIGDDVARQLSLSASPDARRELLTTTAQLTHVLADMSADNGHQGLAQHYYTLALGIASEIGDRSLRAITLRAMSVQALRMEAFRYAAVLADAAVSSTEGAENGDLQAFVLVQRAHVRAKAGQHRSARLDIEASEECHGRADSGEGPFSCYPETGLAYRKGLALHQLGDREAALAALRFAAEDRPPHEFRLKALSEARLALVLLEQGSVDEACVHGRQFTQVYRMAHSRRCELMLHALQARLTPFRRVPEVASLLATLTALGSGPVPAQRVRTR
ncbi:hypothetical protein EV562_103340 [Streptomyces sp. BK208]|nr:hypothetical protein EV562_103340 [Streptomyces sp. BK208]